MIENSRQTSKQQSHNSFYHQQIVSGANIDVLTIKSPNCGNPSEIAPALYIERGSSAENLPPLENNSVSQSINASRSNIGCGKAVSFSRPASQGAYIIPNQSAIIPDNRLSSRAPLATLQPSNRTNTMSQTKRILKANYASMQSENMPDDCHMEQDDRKAQSSNIFQLYSNVSNQKSQQPVRTSLSTSQITSTEVKPPAAKRLKLRESWSR